MYFHTRWKKKSLDFLEIRVGGNIVEVASDFKYSGVTIDCVLRITKKIEKNIKLAYHKLF